MKDFLYSIASGQRRDLIARLMFVPLFLASILYGLTVQAILSAYAMGLMRRKHLSVPVISVGNLTLGGVGKTPMVIYITRLLKSKGLKPAILTRGYMPSGSQKEESDEVRIMRQILDGVPVIVDPDRHKGGLEAIYRHSPDVILLDDGFQHWRLFRNLDVVLIDAVNPFGNKHVLPCGILREPLASLKRADLVVLTKTDQGQTEFLKDKLRTFNLNVPIIESVHRPSSLMNIFTGHLVQIAKLAHPVVAFCGIGHPASFEGTLTTLNADCRKMIPFADHHSYTLDDMKRLKEECDAHKTNVLITTQKDAVKVLEYEDFWQGYEIYSLNIDIEITKGQHEFAQRICQLLGR
jgi:tetraacyldisaccharide 4'-kinase